MNAMYGLDSFLVTEVTDHSKLDAVEYRDWSVHHIGLDRLTVDGAGQLVGVLDTGCDDSHCDLKGQVITKQFISNGLGSGSDDSVGHGTFVTSQIVAKRDGAGVVGAAPGARALHCKVLYGNELDYSRAYVDDDIAEAIRFCADFGCGVISMSFGGSTSSFVIESAVNHAVSHGVIVVAAAGNDKLTGSLHALYPAALPAVISVASANKKDLPSWFSTVGNGVDPLTQPEVAIAGLEYYWGCLPGNKFGNMTGTSMATPTLAAVALLWRQARAELSTLPPGPRVQQAFRQWLHRVADDSNKNGWDPELGFGTLVLDVDESSMFGRG